MLSTSVYSRYAEAPACDSDSTQQNLDSDNTDEWTITGPNKVEDALAGSKQELIANKDDVITISTADRFHLADLRFHVAYAKTVTVDITIIKQNGDLKTVSIVVSNWIGVIMF